jgi:hypothetical protein
MTTNLEAARGDFIVTGIWVRSAILVHTWATKGKNTNTLFLIQ